MAAGSEAVGVIVGDGPGPAQAATTSTPAIVASRRFVTRHPTQQATPSGRLCAGRSRRERMPPHAPAVPGGAGQGAAIAQYTKGSLAGAPGGVSPVSSGLSGRLGAI